MLERWHASPRRWAWGLVALWCAAYGLLKWHTQVGLDIDGAEQVYFAQSWQMGYGTRQPPLYTWLLLALKPDLMPWGVTLELARYAVLGLWLAGVQCLAAACGASPLNQARAVLLHLGCLLVLWRVHDSLTHTVLGACLTTWGTVALLRAWQRPAGWVGVGVLAALACLSKLNAAVWCLSSLLVSVALMAAELRQPGQHRAEQAWLRAQLAWIALGAVAFAVLMAPYVHWWTAHRQSSLALAQEIVLTEVDLPWWRPLTQVLQGGLEYLLLAPLVAVIWGWRHRHKAGSIPWPQAARWVCWQTALGMVILVALLAGMHGSHFTPRWLWPVIPGVTVWTAVWAAQVADRMTARGVPHRFDGWVLAVPVLALALVAVRVWEPRQNAQRCVNCWTDRPAKHMAGALQAQYGPELRVLAGDAHLAGVLAAQAPGLRTWTPGVKDLPAPAGFARMTSPCVMAWVSMNRPLPPSKPLADLLARHGRGAVSQVSWPLRLAPQRQIWMQSVLLSTQACTAANAP